MLRSFLTNPRHLTPTTTQHLLSTTSTLPIPKRPRERKTSDSKTRSEVERLRRRVLSKGPEAKVSAQGFISRRKAEAIYGGLMFGGGGREEGVMEEERGRERVGIKVRVSEEDREMIGYESRMHGYLVGKKAEDALEFLKEMEREGVVPSVMCYFLGVRVCYARDKLVSWDRSKGFLTEDALRMMLGSGGNVGFHHLGVSGKTMMAKLYGWRGEYRKALKVMGFDLDVANVDLDHAATSMKLGSNDVAWMTVMDILNKNGQASFVPLLFEHMVLAGCAPRNNSYSVLISALGACGNRSGIVDALGAMLRSSLQPCESTVALAISQLCRGRPPCWVAERVSHFIKLVEEPSLLFTKSALRACGRCGAFESAHKLFKQVCESSRNGIADEGSYLSVILAGSNAAYWKLEESDSEKVEEDESVGKLRANVSSLFDEINAVADKAWKEHAENYANSEPTEDARNARSRILQSYVLLKTRTRRVEEAISLIEKSLTYQNEWQKLRHCGPFVSVLCMLEREGGSRLMPKVAKLLEKADVKLSLSTIGYGIGTFVRDGDHEGALRFVKRNEERLQELANDQENVGQNSVEKYVFAKRIDLLLNVLLMHSAPQSTLNFLRRWKTCFGVTKSPSSR